MSWGLRVNKQIRPDILAKFFVFLFFLNFAILLIFAPFFLPTATVKDISGRVGVIDNEKTFSKFPFPWNYIYLFGDLWCHQKTERSIILNGNQSPLCARCLGIFVGLAIGSYISIFFTFSVSKEIYKKIFIILAFFIPMLIDGLGQAFELWHSTNIIRIFTGMLSGFAYSILIGIAIDVVYFTIK